ERNNLDRNHRGMINVKSTTLGRRCQSQAVEGAGTFTWRTECTPDRVDSEEIQTTEIQTTPVPGRQILQWVVIAVGLFVIAALVMLGVVYHRVSKQVDERLAA